MYISKISGSNLDPEKFSEYPAFWSMFPLAQNIECAGLFHYRCILDLSGKHTEDTSRSMNHRKDELAIQSQYLESYTFVIAVSRPLNFETVGLSNWDQLLFCIPDIEFDLLKMCKIFDSITGLSAEIMLKSTSKLYARNMFFGPVEFANCWNKVSFEVLKRLKETKFRSESDRPGGYILERLFSVYLENWKLTHEVVERPYIWFA
jgi:hypothetical protein